MTSAIKQAATGQSNKYYDRYVKEASSMGVTPGLTQDQFLSKLDTSNYEGSYKTIFNSDIGKQALDKYNAAQKAYADASGLPISSLSLSDINPDTIAQKINDLTANTASAAANTAQKDALSNSDVYKPSQDVLDIQKQIKDIVANPYTINPDEVTKWQDWLNTQNKSNDAIQNTRLNEQFSALGDLGSSANRTALTELAGSTQADRATKALSLATSDVNSKYTQISNSLNALLGIADTNQSLALMPVENQWTDYRTKQSDAYDTFKTNLVNDLTNQNNNRTFQQMTDFYNANKPAQQDWWQPILNSALSIGTTAAIGTAGKTASGGTGLIGLL